MSTKTCDRAFVTVSMFSRPPRGLYLQSMQYLNAELLLFGNGIYFPLNYLFISDRGAKSDACLGFELVSATIDLDTTAK